MWAVGDFVDGVREVCKMVAIFWRAASFSDLPPKAY
jgi:hypothetical protein